MRAKLLFFFLYELLSQIGAHTANYQQGKRPSTIRELSRATTVFGQIPVSRTIGAAVLLTTFAGISKAQANELEISPLSRRIDKNGFEAYQQGILTPDIFYPSWFSGVWLAKSTFTDLSAPLGEAAFGGPAVLETVRKDLNTTLEYKCRFRPQADGRIISDRLYNVEQIAISSMGEKSIIDDSQSSRDLASKIQLLIAPPASGVRTVPSPSIHSVNSETVFPNNVLTEWTRIRQGNLFLVTLECTDREQYGVTPNRFDALERSSQRIDVLSVDNPPPSLIKDVETITCYTKVNDDLITARQRTASFLNPLDPRFPMSFQAEPKTASNAVDLRTYDIVYSRIK